MDEQSAPRLKRRRLDHSSLEAEPHSSDQQGLHSTLSLSQPLASSHVYSTIHLDGNSQAIFGDVGDSSSHFFRNTSDEISKKLVLNALYFDGMQSRRDQVAARAGSPKHIEWVWTTSFHTWLKSPESFYWLTGCPGSGKSTLMKHISESWKTMNALQTNGQAWTTIHFFFDFRAKVGTANTIQGMLRSLLHQIAQHLPDVAKHLESTLLADTRSEGGLHDYMDSLCDAIQHTSTNICAFIDGLDEFAGLGSDLLDAIYTLEDRSGIKICMASRPYPVFEDNLSGYQHLVMQDHNYQSIQLYTDAQFKSNRMVGAASLPRQLADKICEKARGVFLWARLATDELLRDLLAGTPVMELGHHLDQMPQEVQEMYQRVLDRLPEAFRVESALLLYMLTAEKGSVEVRKLFIAMKTIASRYSMSGMMQPVNEDSNNDFRLRALLGDFVDVIHQKCREDATFAYGRGKIFYRSIGAPISHARLTHETLYAFLTKNAWLEDIISPHFSMTNGPHFWSNLYLDEMLDCLERYEALPSTAFGEYRSIVKKLANPLAFGDQCAASGEAELEGNLDLIAVRKDPLDGIDTEINGILNLWKEWTPLLPYAIQDNFLPGCHHIKYSYDERIDDLQRILQSPVSWLHKLIRAFQGLYPDKGCFRLNTWTICGYDAEPEYASSLMLLDPHISIPLCRDMSSYLTQSFSRDPCSIPPAMRQLIFDLVWDRQMFGIGQEWGDFILLLARTGNYFNGKHLCRILQSWSTFSQYSLVLDLLKLCQDVQTVLSEYHPGCTYHQSLTPEVGFLCHCAGFSEVREDSTKQDVKALFEALSIAPEHLNQIAAPTGEPLLNMILKGRYGETGGMALMTILALQAGANPYVTGSSGTAFDVAKTLLAGSRLNSWAGSRVQQMEKIVELLEHYANHDGTLPPDLSEFMRFTPGRTT